MNILWSEKMKLNMKKSIEAIGMFNFCVLPTYFIYTITHWELLNFILTLSIGSSIAFSLVIGLGLMK